MHYTGLTLDKQGDPTIGYKLAGATVTDLTRPDGNALQRTLTLNGLPTGMAYCRVAAGSQLDEVSPGLYAVNDRSYYIRIDLKTKPKRTQRSGWQEIWLPVLATNGAGQVQYSIQF